MKTSKIKKALKCILNFDYCCYNLVNANGRIERIFDDLVDAQIYKESHKEKKLFIQYSRHISTIL